MDKNQKAFWNVVRKIVREELQRQLPAMVQQTLSEMYVRKIMAESVGEDDYEPTPPRQSQAPRRTGSVRPAPPRRSPLDERVTPLADRTANPLAHLYEDVRPIADENPKELGVLDLDHVRALTERLLEAEPSNSYTDSAQFPDRPLGFDD